MTVESGEDLVAAPLRAAAAGSPLPEGVIDAVETEGWQLEHITRCVRPLKVTLSPFGAYVFVGGQVVESAEEYQYVFRRVDGSSG